MQQYEFVSTNVEDLTRELIAMFEQETGCTVQPASPERLIIAWMTKLALMTYNEINWAANQNLPSRASGENLDALGELFLSNQRPQAAHARCVMEVTLSLVQPAAVLIPAGTRFTSASRDLVWQSVEDVYIQPGELKGQLTVQCQTAGMAGNGYLPGQIQTLVDISAIAYYASCANITTSDGGAQTATDEEYYQLLRLSQDALSTAGAMGSYIYWAKTVSTQIADVVAMRPRESVEKTIPAAGSRFYLGGEGAIEDSVEIYSAGTTLTEDYDLEWEDGMLVAVGTFPAGSTAKLDMEMAGCVNIYALMDGGSPAGETIKSMIYEACSEESRRPLTDRVSVEDPELVHYTVSATYYLTQGSARPTAEIDEDVQTAVQEYISWQCAKLGRDINPTELHDRMKVEGVKRIVITSPEYTVLSSGKDGAVPQLAVCDSSSVTSGGAEEE